MPTGTLEEIARQKTARRFLPFILLFQTAGIAVALVLGAPWSFLGMAVAGVGFVANFAVFIWGAIRDWVVDEEGGLRDWKSMNWDDEVGESEGGRFYFGIALTVFSAAAAFAIAFGFFSRNIRLGRCGPCCLHRGRGGAECCGSSCIRGRYLGGLGC